MFAVQCMLYTVCCTLYTYTIINYDDIQEKRFGKGCVGSVDELLIHFNSILEKRSGCVLKHAGN